MYCSRTIFEDATPELVRDFFWDGDFRLKWDPMLAYSKSLDEFPQNGATIVHWIKKVFAQLLLFPVYVHVKLSIPTCCLFSSSRSFAVTVNTSLEDAYGNQGRLTIVLQRYVYTVFTNRYFYSCNVMLPPLSEKKIHIIV